MKKRRLLELLSLLLLAGALYVLSACSSDSDSSSDSPQAETTADTTQEETSQEDDIGSTSSNAPEVRYFAVTFETFGGTDIAPQSVEFGKTATKPTDPTKDGYIFAGWYTDSGLTAIFSFGEAVAKSITLFAKWIDASVPTFTVTFEADGGCSVDSQTVEPGKNATKPADPTRDGLVFAGWYTDVDCTTVFDFDGPITKDIVLYAKWIVSFTVTFEADGGSSVDSQTVEPGKNATKPTDPTREGLVFAGWYTDVDCTTVFDFDEPITKHIILYAKWIDASVPTVTVTFETDGGSSVKSQVVESGLCVSEPASPTKETVWDLGHESEYEFAGWYTDSGFSEQFNFGSAVTADTTLYAKWNVRLSVEVKDGESFNTFLKNTLGASRMTAFKRASEAPSTAAVYYLDKYDLNYDLDNYETDPLIPIWYDTSSRTVFYYVPDNVCKLKIRNGYRMFYECFSLKELDVSGFDTSKVTNMSSMFDGCSLKELDVSGFDTSNVTNMSRMFMCCASLTELDVSGFDTSNVTNMDWMFYECRSLKELDVSGFDTSNVTNMGKMFSNCGSLVTIYASSSADWNHHVYGPNMFEDCKVLKGGNGTKYSSSNVFVTYAHVDTEGNPGYFTAKN